MLSELFRSPPALTDALLEASMASLIEAAKVRHALGDGESQWRPGDPLKLLLVGYLGTRNTGADVRVAEMIRQFRWILGEEQLELSVMTSDPRLSAGYFPGVRQITQPELFPPFLFRETAKHHGVIACEGSMFKSKFANALTTFMVGALGLAAAQNKLSVGYGAEAGEMDPLLRSLVSRYCRDSFILVRNQASRRILDELGVQSAAGTDTAWSFQPKDPLAGRALLRRSGWDGRTPLLVLCPINPFWWPVRPAAAKALVDRFTGQFKNEKYRSLYYHSFSARDRARYESYLDALAGAVRDFAPRQGVFVVLVGMERIDRRACEHLAERLGPTPSFVSDEYDMHQLVSILREARYLVSSRYHAMVCSTAAGVPSVGLSMDERIRNLLVERGQAQLCLEVDAPDLGERLRELLQILERDGERLKQESLASMPRQLRRMGEMGMAFEDRLLKRYPEFPRRDMPRDWHAYLPPLAPELAGLLDGGEQLSGEGG